MPGCRRRRGPLPLPASLCALALLAAAGEATAQGGVLCDQARTVAGEVAALYARGNPDHELILRKLAPSRDLCPSLGELWKYSYCSAKALGRLAEAEAFRGRAVFNGVEQLECFDLPKPLPTWVGEKYALLIGVGSFADPALPALSYSAKDARDLRAVLVDPEHGRFASENVYLLTDAEATRERILAALDAIMKRAREEDLVLLFASTHGLPTREGAGLGGIGYIATHDIAPDRPWERGLEFQDLSQALARMPARRRIAFLDTCYSGSLASRGEGSKDLLLESPGLSVSDEDLARLTSSEGTFMVMSSEEQQVSWESDALRNGFFTYFLIEALRQGPEPPDLDRVFRHLQRQVADRVAAEKNARQIPRIFPEDGDLESFRIGVEPLRGRVPPATPPARP